MYISNSIRLSLRGAIALCLISGAVLFGIVSLQIHRHASPANSSGIEHLAARFGKMDIRRSAVQKPLSAVSEVRKATVASEYGKLPLSFEQNDGQTDQSVKFLSRGPGYSLFLTSKEAVVALRKAAPRTPESPDPSGRQRNKEPVPSTIMRMKVEGANASPRVVGTEELPGKVNYFIGNDPAKWRTGVSTYAKVQYEDVYPGVHLVYYGNQNQLEYDFIVAAGADPGVIQLKFDTDRRLNIDKEGGLVFEGEGSEVRFKKPVVYQKRGGEKIPVEGSYVLTSENRIRFRLGEYDHSLELVVDPVLVYSTYLGGNGFDNAAAIAVDASGNAYVTGYTTSTNFPAVNALQGTNRGTADAFVVKINSSGSAVVYSTYLGGSRSDAGNGIAVDGSGNAYVTGFTQSSNFPIANALQATLGGALQGAFVSKLDPSGSALLYSTYLCGNITDVGVPGVGLFSNDVGYGIAVDGSGSAYVTGSTTSTNFPTANAAQGTYGGGGDAFAAKFNPSGSALVYSTYLGGSRGDAGLGIAVDGSGSAYVTGSTISSNFPTANALQATPGIGSNAFVTKVDPSGSTLVYSTYLGGNSAGTGIAVDGSGSAYVTGNTSSTTFPTVNAAQGTYGGGGDAFVAKFNPSGSALVYSTYLGGSGIDSGYGITVDGSGNAYLIGQTNSPNFPTASALQETYAGAFDAFVAKLDPTGSSLVYSTYLGGTGFDDGLGIAVNASGDTYVTGYTQSTNFPTANALQATLAGPQNIFVARISTTTTFTYRICALYDQTRSVPSGAVVPIKLQLCDLAGNDLSSSAIGVHATQVIAVSGFVGPPQAVGNANPDSDFRFDSTLGLSGGYIFNLSTKGLASGTYSLRFTAGADAVTHSVSFSVQ